MVCTRYFLGRPFFFPLNFAAVGPPGDNRRRFIKQLLDAAGGRRTHARTAATFTLLKLREGKRTLAWCSMLLINLSQ